MLFIGSFLIYKNIYPSPRNWYDHYLYLSKSILQGRVDLPDLPSFYHDKLEFKGKTYIPFPPGASFLLIPFILAKDSITQQQVSILIGSANVVLMYFLLLNLTTRKKSILLAIFFGFGTSLFWASVVGTTWYFAHTVAIFFLLASLILYYKNNYFFSGIFFALSAITRIPMIFSGLFFALELRKHTKKLFLFLCGAFIFVPIFLSYNFLRFGNILETGYERVYEQYNSSGLRVSVFNNYGYFSYKNIPAHLYSLLIMPPDITVAEGKIKDLRPSPYGMGILFTSPLLFLALRPKYKRGRELNLITTAILCALPSFLHYAQGWVQFGYRFVLDFIVFLMMILSIRFKINKLTIFLILFSILINFWGVSWAIELGW